VAAVMTARVTGKIGNPAKVQGPGALEAPVTRPRMRVFAPSDERHMDCAVHKVNRKQP
jgi:hypothetical protein